MRSFITLSARAVTAIALVAVFMPASVLAQSSCNADISVATTGGGELEMGQPIPIVVTLGAGQVLDASQPGGLGWLDISQFEYKLDCNVGETFETCTDAGNTVDFVESSLWTDCTDEQDPAQAVVLEMDENPDTDKIVVFTPSAPHVIRNASDTTCQVGFDVIVEAVAPGNINRVVEITGWVNPGPDENLGVCSNGLPAAAAASISFDFNVTTTFRVTKDFSDDNSDPVEVHLQCDAGIPLYQSFMLTEGSKVDFVVRDYQPGELDCRVWETPVDDYEASYEASAPSGVGTPSSDANGCYFNAVEGGGFLCAIANEADPGTFTVDKEWILGETEEEDIDLVAYVTLVCNAEILEDDAQMADGYWYVNRELIGETDWVTITVDAAAGTTQCAASESQIPSYVSVDNGCADMRDVVSGADTSCLIVNTMFFEGIPTLSHYGLAILVVLTLGIGAVGFRRYA